MAQTYNEIYLTMRRMLREAGAEDPALEARRLLALSAGLSEAELMARLYLYAGDETVYRADGLMERRMAGEPLAYILGEWEFYGLPMLVNSSVLIPRMDTEVLVSTAVGLLRRETASPRILDLCCGSGCIGCALAHELPSARVFLADISADALAVARKNISLNHLTGRCVCMDADALSPPPLRMENFDLLACNPPYIRADEIPTLDPSVRDWEPHLALDGGEDGLIFYISVLEHWKSILKDGGYAIFEVGEGQADSVSRLMAHSGFHSIHTVPDTIGVERVVYGQLEK